MTSLPVDSETYLRVTIANESTSVRVLYVLLPELTIIGIFRLDDDAEVDFKSLSIQDQTKIEETCESNHQHNHQ